MREMGFVFEIIDELGISREKVEVPLLPRDDGTIRILANGKLEITLPEDRDAHQWLQEARPRIAELASDLLGSAGGV